MTKRDIIMTGVITLVVTALATSYVLKNKSQLVERYENGNIKGIGGTACELKQGEWRYYYNNVGTGLSKVVTYKFGQRHGPAQTYNLDGVIVVKGDYVNDAKNGTWRYPLTGECVVFLNDEVVADCREPVVAENATETTVKNSTKNEL